MATRLEGEEERSVGSLLLGMENEYRTLTVSLVLGTDQSRDLSVAAATYATIIESCKPKGSIESLA